VQVARWGNSLAIRLPVSVVRALDLREGDEVSLDVAGERAIVVEKSPAPAELLSRLRALRGSLPADFRFDRLEANAR